MKTDYTLPFPDSSPDSYHPTDQKPARGGRREGAGRPRKTKVPRCSCGVTTLKRAMARGKERTHKAGCTFAVEVVSNG